MTVSVLFITICPVFTTPTGSGTWTVVKSVVTFYQNKKNGVSSKTKWEVCQASVYTSKKIINTTDGYRILLFQTYFDLCISDNIENTNKFNKQCWNSLFTVILPVLKCNVKKKNERRWVPVLLSRILMGTNC